MGRVKELLQDQPEPEPGPGDMPDGPRCGGVLMAGMFTRDELLARGFKPEAADELLAFGARLLDRHARREQRRGEPAVAAPARPDGYVPPVCACEYDATHPGLTLTVAQRNANGPWHVARCPKNTPF